MFIHIPPAVFEFETLKRETEIRKQSERIAENRARALLKHGTNSIEAIKGDDPRWATILMEEVGEVAHALTYDFDGPPEALTAELYDVATVVSAWLSAVARDAQAVHIQRESEKINHSTQYGRRPLVYADCAEHGTPMSYWDEVSQVYRCQRLDCKAFITPDDPFFRHLNSVR